jgi:hypothetical protein
MTDRDEPLDPALEDDLRRHARSIDGPVDHRAIARRAMATPVRGSGPSMRIAGGLFALAAAAGILIVALGIGALRGGPTPAPIGASPSPSTAPGPTPTASPSPSASPAPTPSPASSPTAAPSAAPASPAGAPASSAPPTASTAPTAAPTPSPPASSAPPATSVPSNFSPLSVTFASPNVGFVLGAVPCGSGSCPAVARTDDAGRTWSMVPGAPKTTIAQPPVTADATQGVSSIRFATDQQHGWIYGPELWSTDDGGASWVQTAAAGAFPGEHVVALETARGMLYVVVADINGFRVLDGTVGSGELTTAITLPFGAGPVPDVQLVLGGSGGWVLQNDRTVVNGARLVGTEWQPWSPVCADAIGPAYLAAASSTRLAAACDVGAWATPQGTHLYTSTDGGDQWKEAPAKIPVTATQAIATPDGTNVFVAGSTAAGSELVASADAGRTWHTALNLEGAQAVDLGFTTPTQGVVIEVRTDGRPYTLLMTRDGGVNWVIVVGYGLN